MLVAMMWMRPACTSTFSGRIRYSSRVSRSTPPFACEYDGPPPHPARDAAPTADTARRAGSQRMRGSRMMPGRMPSRPVIALLATVVAAGAIGCGTEKGDKKQPDAKVTTVDPQYQEGAKLFAERCSGCHNLGI